MNRYRLGVLTLLSLATLMAAIAFTGSDKAHKRSQWPLFERVVSAQAPVSPCPSYTALSPSIPADMAPPNSQANANCFAWAEFIALNWTGLPSTCAADPAATAATFGTPLDNTPKVWELYAQDTDIFLPGAAAPTAWCSQSEVVSDKFRSVSTAQLLSQLSSSSIPPKFLSAISKDADDPQVKLSAFEQAGSGSWLTAQSGIIALYEIRVNQDEFSYIDSNGLYNAQTQQTFVLNPGVNLPVGTSASGGPGSIELKASWIELDNSQLWPLYKTSTAWVVYPGSTTPKQVTVGLTGLHIIHKTANSQQFVWATFEHVNNAPSTTDISNGTLLPWYTFYNASCNPQSDHYQCAANAQIAGSTPAAPYFPHTPTDPMSAPIQVIRQNPISTSTSDNIQQINLWAQALIASSNPNSVFKNYQLVDVLWPQNSVSIPAASTIPLTNGNPQPNPSLEFVANTTLETYLQNTDTCLSCHVYAPIATVATAQNGKMVQPATRALLQRPSVAMSSKSRLAAHAAFAASPTYASDYSFLFSEAATPSTTAALKVRRLSTKATTR